MWCLKNDPKNLLLGFVFLLLLNSPLLAQRQIPEEGTVLFKDRLFYGGNFSMSFGTITFFDISPMAGVMLSNKMATGVGATYQYFDDKRFFGGSNSLYGGRVFGRYNILQNIFAHAEYESLNFELLDFETNTFRRNWVPGLLVGGGYFMPFGNRGGANITFLYNLLHDNRRSPYNEPFIIRVGFFL